MREASEAAGATLIEAEDEEQEARLGEISGSATYTATLATFSIHLHPAVSLLPNITQHYPTLPNITQHYPTLPNITIDSPLQTLK